MICGSQVVDPCQAHFLYQAVLQRFEQSLDPSFRLGTVCRDPFNPQVVQRSPELRSQRISTELSGKWLRAGLLKDAVFIGVMGQGTSIASQPFPKRPQVLFRGVVLGEPGIETAGGDYAREAAQETVKNAGSKGVL
jgi:hypothetical protein